MRFLIADDHRLILDSLKKALENEFSNDQIISVSNKNELYYQLEAQKTDLLLLDIHFGADYAGDFIEDLNRKFPALKIVILSSENKPYIVAQFKEAEIAGYIHKSESLENIENAIHKILDNNIYFSEIVNSESIENNALDLTPREKEVLKEILKEKQTKVIADDLKISEKTVEMHRNNLFIKFDVSNVAGLVKKAYQLGYFN